MDKLPSKIVVKRLRAVQEQILKEPRQFQMTFFYHSADSMMNDSAPVPNCGTAACLVGWLIALDEKTTPKQASETITPNEIWRRASRLLELKGRKRLRDKRLRSLSSTGHWPLEFNERWNHRKNANQAARIAVARINYFIKTGI
jgi:hypothetical protein